MSFDKIFVLGAGAIGSVYGALLSEKNDVTLIGSKGHVNAISSKGLSISGEIKDILQIEVDTEIRAIPEKTLILLTTKAHDSAKAVRRIKNKLREDTVILVLQNGLGNKEVVSRIVGCEAEILRGVTAMAAEFFEPGKVRFWKGETTIEKSKAAEMIQESFIESELSTKISEDITRDVWEKVVVNCVVNPLSALLRARDNELITESLRSIRHGIVRECVAVGEAEEVMFPHGFEEIVDRRISKYKNFSSMYQDLIKKKRTEIDFLNGKLVELARKHDIPTPLNEALTSFIKFMGDRNGVSG
ncbi:2-dehydropantoate 2-reductase [Candidatus Bathyarchaeota archaeon]|nr:2-dehydropantoate 2-reductase [Candidatus Bathyarchaeota archaeon]